jgi:CRISPR-associated protein Cas1
MKKSLVILSSGEILRKDNTLLFVSSDGERRYIPINLVSEIEVFGEVSLNKKALEFLSHHKIPVHFYNYYGYYVGTYYPREHLNSGYVLLKQVEHRLEENKRLFLAKAFLIGALSNLRKNLKNYEKKFPELKSSIREIEELRMLIDKAEDIPTLMALEGNARQTYYASFELIVREFPFKKRTKRPPEDEINALISFGNSLLYTKILTEIYFTHLDPRIGYLHETNMRSFNLNLDLAEIFKPIIVDRVIFQLTNKRILSAKDFSKEAGVCYLNSEGKKKFLKAFQEKLATTVRHRRLRRKVSYRNLIRLECYKLIKHLIGDEIYEPLVAWW